MPRKTKINSLKVQHHLTLQEAAAMLDRSHSQVARYVRAGLLRAVRIGTSYFIPAEAIKAFRYPKPGRRPKS